MGIICVTRERVLTTGRGIRGGFNYDNFVYIRVGAPATIGLFALPLFNFLTKKLTVNCSEKLRKIGTDRSSIDSLKQAGSRIFRLRLRPAITQRAGSNTRCSMLRKI